LLAQLETGATNPYAIAPIPGFIYDDPAQVYWARERTQALYRDVVPLLSRLHQLRYHLDDTPGIPLSAALAWWKQADSLIAQFPTYQIDVMDGQVGRPKYQVHSSFMLEELRLAELQIPELQRFLLEVPYPTPLPKFVFQQRLSSRDYPALFDTPVQEVVAKQGKKLTTGSGDRYPERRTYMNWSFDHAFSLARTSESFFGFELGEADLTPHHEPITQVPVDVRAQLLDIQERITKLLEAFPERD